MQHPAPLKDGGNAGTRDGGGSLQWLDYEFIKHFS